MVCMAAREKSPDYGLLQEFVDTLFTSSELVERFDVVLQAESYGLNEDLLEIVTLLPPGVYSRERLCGQFNSSLSSHGWGYFYGTVA